MDYTSVFTISYSGKTDAEAVDIARAHHELLRDALRVEGADHPHDIVLTHVFTADSQTDILPAKTGEPIR